MKKTFAAIALASVALQGAPLSAQSSWSNYPPPPSSGESAVPPAPPSGPNIAYNDPGNTNSAPQINYQTTENGIQYWQGQDGRTYCKKKDGTVGLLVGAAVGVLIGRAIDTHGERATGTILGGIAGAIIGKKLAEGSKPHCQ